MSRWVTEYRAPAWRPGTFRVPVSVRLTSSLTPVAEEYPSSTETVALGPAPTVSMPMPPFAVTEMPTFVLQAADWIWLTPLVTL